MIVKIVGSSETADRARAMIHEGGGRLVEHAPAYTFVIYESDSIKHPIVDGVDCQLESRFVNLLAELTPSGAVTLAREGGNQDDRTVVLTVPASSEARHAAALAIYRTAAQLSKRRFGWFGWLFASLLFFAAPAHAQITGGTVDQGATQTVSSPWNVQFVASQHIICDSGCGSPAATPDNSAFTAGTTSVSPVAGIFNDGLAAVTSGNQAAPRITSQRAWHINLRDNSGNEISPALALTQTDRTQKAQITDGTRDGTVKAASTLPLATDTAVVATLRDAATLTNTDTTGLPVIQGRVAAGTAAWTSATALNTALTLTITDYATVLLSFNFSGTFTGGVLTFEGSDDGASTWYSISGITSALTSTGAVIGQLGVSGTAAQLISFNVVGLTTFRARLSTAITSTGTVNLRVQASAAPINYLSVLAPTNAPNTITAPTLTKGNQGSTGFTTQDLKDAGRTAKSFYANNIASGTTTTETLITLTQSSGTSATSSAASYTITGGKTFRLQSIVVGSRGNATATIQITIFNLRLNTGGACIVTSTPILMGVATATPATASAWDRAQFTIPDGYEIAGNGSNSICISANAVFVTNAPTWFVNIIGYEY